MGYSGMADSNQIGSARVRTRHSAKPVNKTHTVMHLSRNVAMNSRDIKECKPAKAATLPQPSSGHAVSDPPRHEQITSHTPTNTKGAAATNNKGPQRGP